GGRLFSRFLMPTTKIPRREFLQLCDTYKDHNIAGWYVSAKLDGMRCFWDGGLSRGVKTMSVPWANIFDPKTGKMKEKIAPVATGLWSRYGNPIQAPDWFLNCLPCCPLDGELFAGRGNFQLAMSICRGDAPDPRFEQIGYAVYSSPPFSAVFASGQIKNANMLRQIDMAEVEEWVKGRQEKLPDLKFVMPGATFDDELVFLRDNIETQNDQVYLHKQTRLPIDEAARMLDELLAKEVDAGGEGVVVRDPSSCWVSKRHKGILKVKPHSDAEAVIVGFVAGREGKQGNVLGKIGTLVVRTPEGATFELGTGLDMEERALDLDAACWAAKNPGERLPEGMNGRHFKVGQTVTYLFRELTQDQIPREARFWRKRSPE
ncbi:MAG: hypothetical protein ACREJM_14010, partial [Candidatus Saccharimonadales bacterium]